MQSIFKFPVDSNSNLELLSFISLWLNTPYQYGKNSDQGTDCSGFVGRVYRGVYDIRLNRSSASIFQQCTPLSKESLREGDLLFFKIRKGRISHVGIYLKDGYFAHASIYNGVTMNHLDEAYYQRHFFRGGRIPEN